MLILGQWVALLLEVADAVSAQRAQKIALAVLACTLTTLQIITVSGDIALGVTAIGHPQWASGVFEIV